MDSVTQFALGAALGEATLRQAPREGAKVFTWGAFLLGGLVGTIPDLDVFLAPYMSAPQALASHRGITHSIFFCTLFSPLLAWALMKIFRGRGLSYGRWLAFVWLTLNTHWMLDCLTTYGTQIFQPFSNYPVNIGSVFIIDPVYTIPLIVGTFLSVWRSRKPDEWHPRPVRVALLLSTLYLGFTLFSKFVVFHRLESSWLTQGIEHRQMITAATPFNSLLYYAYVDTGEDVWVADGSLFDSASRKIPWQRVPKNAELLPKFGEGEAGKVLLWFSRGFYRLDMQNGVPVFMDLRFGRLGGWFPEEETVGDDFVFRFELLPAETQGPYTDFTRARNSGRIAKFPWGRLWTRMWGGSFESESS